MASELSKNTKTYTLNDGSVIPAIGLGTWRSLDANQGYQAVLSALKNGYRHIDTAAIYQNEDQVGRAIRDSGVPREEIFVTTKLWCTQHTEPLVALKESLERLGLEYVDLYLMHWPVRIKPDSITDGNKLCIPTRPDGARDVDIESWNFVKTWELMQELPATGLTKSIGVSNFSIQNIKDLFASPGFKIVPVVNQVEVHPLLPQQELIDFCFSKNIQIEAYSPLGSENAPLLTEPIIIDIAKKHNATPGHVVISWHVQRGYIVLPKSVKEHRIISNLQTFTLSKEDMDLIATIPQKKGELRVCVPDWRPFVPFV